MLRHAKRELRFLLVRLLLACAVGAICFGFIEYISNGPDRLVKVETEGPGTPMERMIWFPEVQAGLRGYLHYWPVAVSALGVVVLVVVLTRVWWSRRTAHLFLSRLASMEQMRRLSWEEFERACSILFRRFGYEARPTDPGADQGIDIALRKDGLRGIAQCKHWAGKAVGVAQVRELLGTKQDVRASMAFMVTSGEFTPAARELGGRNEGLILWDGDTIRGMASRIIAQDVARETLQGEAASEPGAEATSGERVCPQCGEKLVERDGRYGRFIGCSGFPKCRYTRDL